MIPEIDSKLISLGLLLTAVALNPLGETFLKKGLGTHGELRFTLPALLKTFTTPAVLMGLSVMFMAALLWMKVLSREPLSWAFPILSLQSIVILIASHQLLGETVSVTRIAGVLLILAGVTLVFRS